MTRIRRLASINVVAVLLTLTSVAIGQTASSLSLSGLATSPLNQPGTPSVTGYGTCSGAGTLAWAYAIAAVDGAGGTTNDTAFGPLTTGTCTTLTNANYFTISTVAVPGAVSCNIYRTSVPTGSGDATGLIGTVLCGSMFFDVGTIITSGAMPPTNNTSGAVNAYGSVAASSFTAHGTTAGASIWMTGGTSLPGCATQPLPCIPSTNAFFLQAPLGSISASFGWTAPMSANTPGAYQLLLVGPPVTSGGTTASPLSYVGSDTTTTHALFATSSVPAFRAMAIADLPTGIPNANFANPSATVNGVTCTLGAACTITLDEVGNLATSATNTFAAVSGWTLAGTQPVAQTITPGTSAGTLFAITAPVGGATSAASVSAGQGGGVSITSGTGGTGTGTTDTGGAGGDISITTMNGGNGTSTGGRGGNIVLNAGGPGTGGTPFTGSVQIQQQGTAIFVAGGNGQTTINSGLSTGTTLVSGGNDGSAAASTFGPITIRGANITGGATAGSTSGSATVQGGDNLSTATSGTTTAGDLTLRPGAVTAAGGTESNGRLKVETTAIKGSTYNAGNLGCVTSSNTIGDCASGSGNAAFVGVNQTNDGNAAVELLLGWTTANSNAAATFTAGHLVCTDPTNAAKVIDGGSTTCSSGVQVGVILVTDSSQISHTIVVTR